MYKTTDDEVLGKGRRSKIDKTRCSPSPEASIKKKENISKSIKTKKKDEHSQRKY